VGGQWGHVSCGLPPRYWTICILILPLLAYLNTLADIHISGEQIRIRRWWGSIYICENDILEISPSILEGIRRMRVRRFVPPWGIVYFVSDWSSVVLTQVAPRIPAANRGAESLNRVPNLFASVLLGASGFVLGRVLGYDLPGLSITESSARALALLTSGALAVFFAFTRKRMPTWANILLFSSTLIAALIWGGWA
jgi:hypothetical protein